MLEKIYYVTEDNNLAIPIDLIKELKKKGIKFYQGSWEKIKEQSWEDTQNFLFLCDREKVARELKEKGYFVVIICNEKNKEENFQGFVFALEDFSQVDVIYYIKIWQRFMNIPWHITDTDRCMIREMTVKDIDELYKLYEDESITKYMEGLYDDKEMEFEYINKYIENVYSYFGFGTWLIIRKQDGKLIGRAGFNYRPKFIDPELGFMIGAPFQKKGYAYEVCSKLIEYGKEELGFESIQALTYMENSVSINLLKKLGFKKIQSCMIDEITYYKFKKEC